MQGYATGGLFTTTTSSTVEPFHALTKTEKIYKHIQVVEPDFIKTGVEYLVERIKAAIKERGVCLLGLSGGSTPGPIYEELGKVESIDWSKLYIFLVDERHISAAEKDSNANLVQRTFLKSAKNFPEDHLILPNTALFIDDCILDYQKRLSKVLEIGGGKADILTLGLGPDGHIASIFPQVPKETLEATNLVLHTTTTKFAVFDRITINLRTIVEARNQVFFMKGKDKLVVWGEMLAEKSNPERWPAHPVLAAGNCALVIGA